MFSIARSRKRTPQTRTASSLPSSPAEARRAFFDHLSTEAAARTSRHVRTGTVASPRRTYYNPPYDDLTLDTLTSRFIPNDYRKQNELWRKIYTEDPIAGSAVDLYKDMPWSEFSLLGVKDPQVLAMYEDCLEAIQLESILPFISLDFLTLGRFIAHLLFDQSKGYWSRMIIHDPDYIKIRPIPIPGFAPKLDLVPTDAMKEFALSRDPRDIAAKEQLSTDLIRYIVKGREIPLDPRNTAYIPRRSSATDMVGTSLYTRLLDIIAYQKGLWLGSQAAVRRRLGAVRTVTVGHEEWEPSPAEIDEAVEALLVAEEDPVGAVVGVRTGIEFSEAGGGSAQDILKISDEWQFVTEAKMQALGINESFISGESSYSTMETLLSVFLERIRAHRDFITQHFIINRVLKPIAEINEFYRQPEAHLAHRIRVKRAKSEVTGEELLLPQIVYAKNLRPVADREYLDILEMAAERGLPITLKTWAAFAGFNLDDELEQLPEDLELRKNLQGYKALTDPDYADRLQNIAQDSGLVVPLRTWANAIGLDIDELAVAMEEDVALRRKFRQWQLQASPEMPDRVRDAIDTGVPIPMAELASAYGFNLEQLLAVKDDDIALRTEIKKWLTAISPEATDWLETAQDKGVPVTLETWAKALGLDLDKLRNDADADIELRKELTPWRNAAEGEFEEEDEDEGGFGEEEEGDFGNVPGFGGPEEGGGGLPGGGEEKPELPEVPEELPKEEGQEHVLEVNKKDLPEMMEKIKEKHPEAELPPALQEEVEEGGGEETPPTPPAEEAAPPAPTEKTVEEEAAEEEEELPPVEEKRPKRKLTPQQEKKLTKSIRDILIETLNQHKKAAEIASTITHLYKEGYYNAADAVYRRASMETPEEVPVDLGYLLDGILPADIIPPQGYNKADVYEYRTVSIDPSEWIQLVDFLNQQTQHGDGKSGAWGQSLAEFLRARSPYATHPQSKQVAVVRVKIYVSKTTGRVSIIPERTDDAEKYKVTYYTVYRLQRPEDLDPKKLMITDLERSFQLQLILSDLPKREPLPARSPQPAQPTQQAVQEPPVVNLNISPEAPAEQVIQIMKSLPLWDRRRKFVDLREKEAEVIVRKVVRAGGIGKMGNYRMHMGIFNPKKRQLAQYLLSRLGLLDDVSLDTDVASDIVAHLTKKVPQSANHEQINELFVMATLTGHTTTPSRQDLQRRSGLRKPPIPSGNLLTGIVPKPSK
jgi:hypothetical protein